MYFQTRFLDLLSLLPNPLHAATTVEFFVNGLLPQVKEKVTSLAVYPLEMGQVIEVAKRFCPSNQPRVQVVPGDARIAYMASQDRADPVESECNASKCHEFD